MLMLGRLKGVLKWAAAPLRLPAVRHLEIKQEAVTQRFSSLTL